jgi:hypothetical protein
MLLAVLALAGGLSACGSDDSLSTDIPRTSPDLTIPSETTDLPPAGPTSTSTSTTSTSTTTSSTLPPATTPPAAAEPPAAAAPPPAQAPATTTGGAGSTGAGTTTGGSQPSTGGADFQNFCRDNPGAGPPC